MNLLKSAFKERKITFFVLSVFLFLISVSAQEMPDSANSANRRTAARYLELSKEYFNQRDFKTADSYAQMGLAYDDSVSDLWYIQASSKLNSGEKRFTVIPFFEKAFESEQWIDYNRDNARIQYADLLCSTRRFSEALEILDGEPLIYSSDAEYIRIKCFYNIFMEENSLRTEKTSASVAETTLNDSSGFLRRAREKLDSARKIYILDSRFAELFFRYEYALGGLSDANSALAKSFIQNVSRYREISPELEFYCAVFSEGEEKIRRLKAFNAKSLKSLLFIPEALENKLLTEEAALDYFYETAENSFDFKNLLKFAEKLNDEEIKREFSEYLSSYNGNILFDTDGDGEFNLSVLYERGRPKNFSFDENQDGENEWLCECDFGVPLFMNIPGGRMKIEWESWPYVKNVSYEEQNVLIDFIPNALSWSPFAVVPEKNIQDFLGVDFFIPEILENGVFFDEFALSVSSCTIEPLPEFSERKNGSVKITFLDGNPHLADYFDGETLYARSYFENGIPAMRTVDSDGDGVFETTEFYGYEPEKFADGEFKIPESEQKQISVNLFGTEIFPAGLYVKMIQIDRNCDTVPDFTEEYDIYGGKTSSWDTDNDGIWDVCYKKIPESADVAGADGKSVLFEESLFISPFTKERTRISFKDGKPFEIEHNGNSSTITESFISGLYWLGEVGQPSDTEKVLKNINQSSTENVCFIIENNGREILAVKTDNAIFARILQNRDIENE